MKRAQTLALAVFLACWVSPVQGFHSPLTISNGLVSTAVRRDGAHQRLWARHKHIIAGNEYLEYFQGKDGNDDDGEEQEENVWQNSNRSNRGGRKMDEEEQAYYERINAYQGADRTQPEMSVSSVTPITDKVS